VSDTALFRVTPVTLHLAQPFVVAHGASATRVAHWLRLLDDEGWGEGTSPPYYGVQVETLHRYWDSMAHSGRALPGTVDEVAAWVGPTGPAPARAAVDLALHDRLARAAGQPLHALLGLPRPAGRPSAITVSLGDADSAHARALELRPHRVLKIKLGRADDVARVRAVRAAHPDATLYGDANAAWSAEQAVRAIELLAELGLTLIEQPTGADDIRALGFVQARSAIPVIADESFQSATDLDRLAEAGVGGVNVKLMKLGGVSPAVGVLHRARELGLRTLLGCMIETAIGVTAAAHLADLADWIDLDAPLLVADDPFEGLGFDAHGGIVLPERPGIGVVLRSAQGGEP
jgi:L-alanine-DL-glutamate epimerase-like enolase superfamily enzyme